MTHLLSRGALLFCTAPKNWLELVRFLLYCLLCGCMSCERTVCNNSPVWRTGLEWLLHVLFYLSTIKPPFHFMYGLLFISMSLTVSAVCLRKVLTHYTFMLSVSLNICSPPPSNPCSFMCFLYGAACILFNSKAHSHLISRFKRNTEFSSLTLKMTPLLPSRCRRRIRERGPAGARPMPFPPPGADGCLWELRVLAQHC